jgi:hypothetical protein
MKFKVGDKVKIIGNSNHHGFSDGEEVEILKVLINDPDDYLGKGKWGPKWYLKKEDLSPITNYTFSEEQFEKIAKEIYKLGQGSILGPDEPMGEQLYYDFNFEFIKTL